MDSIAETDGFSGAVRVDHGDDVMSNTSDGAWAVTELLAERLSAGSRRA